MINIVKNYYSFVNLKNMKYMKMQELKLKIDKEKMKNT